MIQSRFRLRRHTARDTVIALCAVLLFAWLAWVTSRDGVPRFDTAVRDMVHGYARPWLTVVMKAASQAGGGWGQWPVGALFAAVLVRTGRGLDAARFGFTVISANLVNEAMKLFFHRPRPEAWFDYPLPPTYSFPSGHAFVSFCFCLCLAELAIPCRWPLAGKVAVGGALLGCTLTIGLSRVYLGVHYPTDVLAGYAAGVAWLTLARMVRQLWPERAARG